MGLHEGEVRLVGRTFHDQFKGGELWTIVIEGMRRGYKLFSLNVHECSFSAKRVLPYMFIFPLIILAKFSASAQRVLHFCRLDFRSKVVVVVVSFSSLARILGDCLPIHSPPVPFSFFLYFILLLLLLF